VLTGREKALQREPQLGGDLELRQLRRGRVRVRGRCDGGQRRWSSARVTFLDDGPPQGTSKRRWPVLESGEDDEDSGGHGGYRFLTTTTSEPSAGAACHARNEWVSCSSRLCSRSSHRASECVRYMGHP
jgi:hypothetical protein